MIVTNLVGAGASEWSTFLKRGDHDVFHTPEYAVATASMVDGEPTAFIAHDGTSEMLLPMHLRRTPRTLPNSQGCRDAISPYGFSGPLFRLPSEGDDAFIRKACESLIRRLRSEDIVSLFVRSHPDLAMPVPLLMEFGSVVLHGDTVSIDLNQTDDELWSQTKPRHRADILRSQSAGLRVRIDEVFETLPRFADVYRENMERVSATSTYLFDEEFFDRLRLALGPRLHLAVVEHDDRVVAGGLFTEVNGRVQYFLSGTSTAYARTSPSKLMLHHVRSWARDRGNRVFHLGGGVGGSADSLFLFKAGFSPLRHPFHSWRVITDPTTYSALAESSGLAGDDASHSEGFFPIYRRGG